MSRITGYKVIQADGNRALAKGVDRFIAEGWEPHGSVYVCREFYEGYGDVSEAKNVNHMFQPIVQREQEHAELERLRELERLVGQIDDEIDESRATLPADNLLAYVQELLAKALRNGPFERKGG